MEALTVQPQRHLSLPDCALFSPTELQITARTSQDDFVRIGKALSAVDDASGLWQCDFSLHAIRQWQEKGLELAAHATGLSQFFLKRCARIAEVFPPARRYPNLSRNHYRILLPFEQSQLDAWLPTVVNQKRICTASLRALAVEQFGEPVKTRQPERRQVNVPETLYARLAQLSPSRKIHVLIEAVLLEWLNKSPEEQQPCLAALAGYKREAKNEKSRAERRAAREKKAAEKAEKLAARQKREAEAAEKLAVRLDYAARRAQQIADGAQPIPRKKRSKYSLRVQWTECRPVSFVDKQDSDIVLLSAPAAKATKFFSEEEAIEAEAEHFKASGYHERVVHCRVCSLAARHKGQQVWHVAHVFSGS